MRPPYIRPWVNITRGLLFLSKNYENWVFCKSWFYKILGFSPLLKGYLYSLTLQYAYFLL